VLRLLLDEEDENQPSFSSWLLFTKAASVFMDINGRGSSLGSSWSAWAPTWQLHEVNKVGRFLLELTVEAAAWTHG